MYWLLSSWLWSNPVKFTSDQKSISFLRRPEQNPPAFTCTSWLKCETFTAQAINYDKSQLLWNSLSLFVQIRMHLADFALISQTKPLRLTKWKPKASLSWWTSFICCCVARCEDTKAAFTESSRWRRSRALHPLKQLKVGQLLSRKRQNQRSCKEAPFWQLMSDDVCTYSSILLSKTRNWFWHLPLLKWAQCTKWPNPDDHNGASFHGSNIQQGNDCNLQLYTNWSLSRVILAARDVGCDYCCQNFVTDSSHLT